MGRTRRDPEAFVFVQVAEAMVDDEDLDGLLKFRWTLSFRRNPDGTTQRFAYRREGSRAIYLHRFVLGFRDGAGLQVRFRDKNGLNCQKANLLHHQEELNDVVRHTRRRTNQTIQGRGTSAEMEAGAKVSAGGHLGSATRDHRIGGQEEGVRTQNIPVRKGATEPHEFPTDGETIPIERTRSD